MTAQEVTGLIGALGFPIFLILAGMWIFVKYLWPWFTTDQAQRRLAESARHADYLTTYRQSSQAIELLTKVFIEFTTLVKAEHESQAGQSASNHAVLVNVIERNHIDLVERLRRIEGRDDE